MGGIPAVLELDTGAGGEGGEVTSAISLVSIEVPGNLDSISGQSGYLHHTFTDFYILGFY